MHYDNPRHGEGCGGSWRRARNGVVSCRTRTGWSAPGFVTITGGSVGPQAGLEHQDMVLLMNKQGEQELNQGQWSLGAGGGSWAKYAGFRRTTGFSVNRQRGQLVESALTPCVTATVHPSSILRAPDSKARQSQLEAFISDLKMVARLAERRRAA